MDALSLAAVLLREVHLVADLATAFALAVGSSSRLSFVTREGDFLAAGGVVTGGRERKGTGSSHAVLARRREMDELAVGIK